MKIWKATLVLFYDMADEWESRFDFKLQDKPFDINIYMCRMNGFIVMDGV